MIPKIIHYAWPGRDNKSKLASYCIKNWLNVLDSSWKIMEWNPDTFDFDKYLKINRFFKEVYDRKLFAFISDYIRLVVLFKYGGIYLDTDVTIVKNFDEDMLNCKMFLPIQNQTYTEPAVFGSEKEHIFLKEMLDFYDDEIWKCKEYTIPNIIRKILKKKYNINNFPAKEEQKIFSTNDGLITFYPEEYFIPFRYGECFLPTCLTDKTTTIHWFNGSWCKDKNLSFLENKIFLNSQETEYLNICFKKYSEYQTKFNLKLFDMISLFKIMECGSAKNSIIKRKFYILHIPILKIVKKNNKTYIKLFGFIPLFKIKKC